MCHHICDFCGKSLSLDTGDEPHPNANVLCDLHMPLSKLCQPPHSVGFLFHY